MFNPMDAMRWRILNKTVSLTWETVNVADMRWSLKMMSVIDNPRLEILNVRRVVMNVLKK